MWKIVVVIQTGVRGHFFVLTNPGLISRMERSTYFPGMKIILRPPFVSSVLYTESVSKAYII